MHSLRPDIAPQESLSLAEATVNFKRWHFSYHPVEELTLRSLCDRDYPVMYWAPRRAEIERIVTIAESLHTGPDKPVILEIGCGSGLLAYLLAETGRVRVIASDPDAALIDKTIYRHPDLCYLVSDASAIRVHLPDLKFTCVLNSWMPPRVNLTPAIRDLDATAIIYVLERMGETGVPESSARALAFHHGTQLDDQISYRPGCGYFRAMQWNGPAHWEITEHFRGYSYSPQITDSNVIEIQMQRERAVDLPGTYRSLCDIIEKALPRYSWEVELESFKGRESAPIRLLAP